MMNWLRTLTQRITPAEVAAKELAASELRLLEALSAREFAEAVITENETRIKRLRKFLADLERKA
jgi:hypothetical protein